LTRAYDIRKKLDINGAIIFKSPATEKLTINRNCDYVESKVDSGSLNALYITVAVYQVELSSG